MAQVAIADLQREGWHLKSESLQRFTEDGKKTSKAVIDAALNADIKDFGEKKLPDLQKSKPESVKGPLVLQIQKLRNISAPKAHEESQAAPPMYRLVLSDGHGQVTGYEMEKISRLGPDTPPGSKVKLVGDVPIDSGHLRLTNKNCQLLGGRVEKLVNAWEVQKMSYQPRRAQEGSEAPPVFIPFGQKRQGQGDQKTGTGVTNTKKFGNRNDPDRKPLEATDKEGNQFETQRKANIEAAMHKTGSAAASRSFAGGRERDVARLQEMGFNDVEARNALQQHGSVTNAISALTEDYPPLRNGYGHSHGRSTAAPAAPAPPSHTTSNGPAGEAPRRGTRGRGRGRGGRRGRGDDDENEGGEDNYRRGPSEPTLSDWLDQVLVLPSSSSSGPAHTSASSSAAYNSAHTTSATSTVPPRNNRPRTGNSEGERRAPPSEMPPRFQKNRDDRSRHASGQSSTDSAGNMTGNSSPVHYLPSALNPPGIPSGGPRSGRGGAGRYSGNNPRVNGYNSSSNNYYRDQGGYSHEGDGYRRGYDNRGYENGGGGRGYGRGMERRGRGRGGYGGEYPYRGRGRGHYMQNTDDYYHHQPHHQSHHQPHHQHHHQRNEQPVSTLVMDGYDHHHQSIPVAEILPPGQFVPPPPLMSVAPIVTLQQSEGMHDLSSNVIEANGHVPLENTLANDRTQHDAAGALTQEISQAEAGDRQKELMRGKNPAAGMETNLEVVDILPGETSIPLSLTTNSVMTEMGTGITMQSADVQNYYPVQMMLGGMPASAAGYNQFGNIMTVPPPVASQVYQGYQSSEPQTQRPPEVNLERGNRCAAKCPWTNDDKYFRAVIQSPDNGEGLVNIFFLDLGNSCNIEPTELRQVPQQCWDENRVDEYLTTLSAPAAAAPGLMPMVQAPGFVISGVPNQYYTYESQPFAGIYTTSVNGFPAGVPNWP